jgi:methyl-accepting chemotaxis protein
MKRTGDSKTLKGKRFKDTKITNLADKEKIKARNAKSHDNETKVSFFATIKFKLIASFMVPIMFIILLGIVSFLKASEVIESKYEKAAEDTINMTGECMKIGFNSVQASAILFANDSLFQRYSLSHDDKVKAFVYADSIGNILCSKKAADEFIKNIYLINENVDSISTGEGIDSGFYKSFKKTDLGKILDNNKIENVWDGEDAFLDKQLKTSADDYSMRLIRNVSKVNSILIIDVKADVVKNILSDLKFDKTGFLGLVTLDGKEIIDDSLKQKDPSIDMEALKSEKIFVNQAFYEEAMAGKEVSGSKYVDYKGTTYLFLYSKVSDTGAALCALMPKSTITGQADSIRNATIIIVIIACILSILIVTKLSSGIDKIMRG